MAITHANETKPDRWRTAEFREERSSPSRDARLRGKSMRLIRDEAGFLLAWLAFFLGIILLMRRVT